MSLTTEQTTAFCEIIDFISHGTSLAHVVSGSAGTGKTHLLKTLVSNLRKLSQNPVVVAPTGKAASNIKDASGKVIARTIHSLLYYVEEVEYTAYVNGKPYAATKLVFKRHNPSTIRQLASVIIVDEASMLAWEQMHDLMELKLPMVFFGDEKQLKAICPEKFNIFKLPIGSKLNQIHRTTTGNAIYKLAYDIIDRKRIRSHIDFGKEVEFIPRKDFNVSCLKKINPDIILSYSNADRRSYNEMARFALHGYTRNDPPKADEPLVCLKNIAVDRDTRIYNGAIYYLAGDAEVSGSDLRIRLEGCPTIGTNHKAFLGEQEYDRWEQYRFDYGYALTVHKSQGSEFDTVVFAPPSYYKDTDYMNLLYTAVTRAKKKLYVVI